MQRRILWTCEEDEEEWDDGTIRIDKGGLFLPIFSLFLFFAVFHHWGLQNMAVVLCVSRSWLERTVLYSAWLV